MLELTRQEVRIDTVNPRAEKHGSQETRLAFDVFCSFLVANDVLGLFDKQLKTALFTKADSPQGELINDPNHLTALRFPKIGAVKWAEEFPGYTLRLHCGINDEQDIVLADAQVDRFSFDPKDGGSVATRFRAIVHPDEKDIARLCGLIQRDCEVSLIPPAPAAQLNVGEGQQADPNAGFADAAAAAIDDHKQRKGQGRAAGGRAQH